MDVSKYAPNSRIMLTKPNWTIFQEIQTINQKTAENINFGLMCSKLIIQWKSHGNF